MRRGSGAGRKKCGGRDGGHTQTAVSARRRVAGMRVRESEAGGVSEWGWRGLAPGWLEMKRRNRP